MLWFLKVLLSGIIHVQTERYTCTSMAASGSFVTNTKGSTTALEHVFKTHTPQTHRERSVKERLWCPESCSPTQAQTQQPQIQCVTLNQTAFY